MKQRYKAKLAYFVRTHRILLASVAAVVLVGVYAFWSVNAWINYTATHERLQATLQADIETAIALPVSNVEERVKKVDALRGITEDIDSQGQTVCRTSSLLRWQEIFPTVKEKQQVCGQFAQKTEAFKTDLQKLIGYLEDEAKLTGILATTGVKTLSENDLEGQTQTWQRAMQDVQSMSVDEAFRPVKEVAVQSTKTIYEAWQKLYDAHKAKDVAAYDQARAKIADAYDTVVGLAGKSTLQFTELTKLLQTAYVAAFQK